MPTDIATPTNIGLPTFSAFDATTWVQDTEVHFFLNQETSETKKADYILAVLPKEVFPLIID